MSGIYVYARGITKEYSKLIKNMMKAVEITSYKIIDLKTTEPNSYNEDDIAIAFGDISGRLAAKHTPNTYIFPPLTKLTLTQENAEIRVKSWNLLQNAAETIKHTRQEKKNKTLKNKDISKEDWKYINLKLSDGKVLCIYNQKKPPIKADKYITVKDVEAIIKAVEVFGVEKATLE